MLSFFQAFKTSSYLVVVIYMLHKFVFVYHSVTYVRIRVFSDTRFLFYGFFLSSYGKIRVREDSCSDRIFLSYFFISLFLNLTISMWLRSINNTRTGILSKVVQKQLAEKITKFIIIINNGIIKKEREKRKKEYKNTSTKNFLN